MDQLGMVVIAALVGSWGVEVAAQLLNLSSNRAPPPEEFAAGLTPEQRTRALSYLRAHTRATLAAGTANLVATLLFWRLCGFGWVDQVVRGWGGGAVVTGVAYCGVILLLGQLITLPFSAYSTFGVEQRFGFNRTSVATFVADWCKGILLAAILGGGVVAGVIALFLHAGAGAWLWGWLAVVLFLGVVQFVAPLLLLPLFFKFTPLAPGERRERLLELLSRLKCPVSEIFVVDGSRRSSKANAFFTGFGRNQRIGLFDTLLANHSTDELLAIVAHEVGHQRHHHTIKSLLLNGVHLGAWFYLLDWVNGSGALQRLFCFEESSVHAALVICTVLLGPVELILVSVLNYLSRRNEYQADRFAAVNLERPEALIDALRRLGRDNLTQLTPHPLQVALSHSHPPLVARIGALRRVIAGMEPTSSGHPKKV